MKKFAARDRVEPGLLQPLQDEDCVELRDFSVKISWSLFVVQYEGPRIRMVIDSCFLRSCLACAREALLA